VVFACRFNTSPNGAPRCVAVQLTREQAQISMPISYERDDDRRLITVTMTEPVSVHDILGAIDRQAAEGTWEYSIFYDQRALTQVSTEADLQQMADRIRVAGRDRTRGPVGIAIRPDPALFLVGLTYSKLTKELMDVEVLLSAGQIESWLGRNSRHGSRQT
jgi:hypothetical protein